MYVRTALLLGLLVALPSASLADFRYDETTKITGGSLLTMAKFAASLSKQSRAITDPVNSTVLVKGNRMAQINQDSSEIIDLDSETITHIDHTKKQYSVVTFEEMKAAIEAAQKKAREQQASQQPSSATPPPDVNFKVNVTNTGATKQVAGLSATESILKMTAVAKDQQSGQTGSLAMTNDMWLAPEIPGYSEVRDFNQRMAQKMGTIFGGALSPAMLSAQPGMSQGLADMVKEMSKLQGVPVSQIMRMGSTTDGSPLPAASEAALPQSNGPSAGALANQAASNTANSAANTATSNAESNAASHMGSLGSALGGLGGLGGFHKKKPQDQPQQQQQPQPAAQQNWMVLMESSTEMTNFSSASVDPALFKVPAGYTKVSSEYQKGQQ